MTPEPAQPPARRIPLPEIARVFFLLGVLGFGGPAVHIALMETEIVTRRQWLSREYFLDLLAAINLVPGPNSTEMALQIGLITGGLRGMMLAAAGFIVPAVVSSVALAAVYTAAGSLPSVQGILIGVKPVVLVLIASAAYRLGQKALDNGPMRLLLVICLLLVMLGSAPFMAIFGLSPMAISELAILLGAGAIYILWINRAKLTPAAPIVSLALLSGHALLEQSPTLPNLFWQFFVIGSTLFGSGYVLAAYLQRTFVDGLHWLTPQQLLDILAIGQATPGPLSSTASAAGYLLTVSRDNLWTGVPGALAATLGVFLPAFVIVLILGRVVPYIRRYPAILDFLKGVNAGVIALLLGTFFNLAWATVVRPGGGVDWLSLALTALAFFLLERYRWNPIILIGMGAVIGMLRVFLNIA